MKSGAPRVSVLMSVYNDGRYICRAIDSILEQTFSDFEFIIINDGSTDNSKKIIQSYQDPRIRLIDLKTNSGLPNALNKGLEVAQGEYIARMDSDDISLPNRLEKQIAYLDTHPEVGVLGSWARLIDENGIFLGQRETYSDHEMIEWSSLFACPMVHPTIMMRENIVRSVGGYRNGETEDYDLWVRLFECTRFANLPEILLLYRRHGMSKTIKFSEIHQAHTFQVVSGLREKYLARGVNLNEALWVEKARHGESLEMPGQVVSVARLIDELTVNFIEQKKVDSALRNKIRKYPADLLFYLSFANYKRHNKPARSALWKAVSLNWGLLLRRSFWRIVLGL